MQDDYEEKRNEELSIQEKFENAVIYGKLDEAKAILDEGYELDPIEERRTIMISNNFEMIKLLERMDYPFKDDEKCIEEYIRYGSGLTEVVQYMLDRGAVISWKALELAVNHYNLNLVKLLAENKNDFFPV